MDASAHKPNVLGSDPMELARLDRQAASIERATRLVLQAAGMGPGLRVLDLGTGLGHVARIAGELVGPDGAVVGLDQSVEALTVARARAQEAGATHVSFIEGDVRTWRAQQPFDAIVERLVLFHLQDPAAVVRHHCQNLRPGGRFVAIDFDIGASGTCPPAQFLDDALRWVMQAFSAAGASPRIGARLGPILASAGLESVGTFGVQGYLLPHDPAGPALLAGVIRSLAATIVQHGIATLEQLDLPTLEARIGDALKHADAVMLPPTVVGAWGRSAAS